MIRHFLPLLFAAALVAQEKAKVDPIVAKFRNEQNYTPKFKQHVFTGKKFPELDQDLLLESTAVFYDRGLQTVTEAANPGPYLAVVTIRPNAAASSKRFVRLYRQADDEKIDGTSAADARRMAGALLNSAFAKAAGGRVGDDAAMERHTVLHLKRKLYGWDKELTRDVKLPTVSAEQALIVREGEPAEAGVRDDAFEKIDAVLTEWAMDSDQAFAVCVVRKGVIVIHKAYGTRNGQPMTVETKSWMASVTKTMSATLLMMLVDRGLVGLDDDVAKYFPPLKEIKLEKPLRVRNLLNHTGGLAEYPMHDDAVPDVEERLAQVYARLRVGEKFEYGGTGNVLAGKIVEAVTGLCVPIAYRRSLLDPLGMTNTAVTGTHADARSVPLDMARFGQMLLNRGSYGRMQFMKPTTFDLMLPRKLTAELGDKTEKTFGLGLDGTPKKFGHGAASSALFSIDVENELVIVMTRDKMGKNDGKHNGPFLDAIKNSLIK